jgi:hypothetical protein
LVLLLEFVLSRDDYTGAKNEGRGVSVYGVFYF